MANPKLRYFLLRSYYDMDADCASTQNCYFIAEFLDMGLLSASDAHELYLLDSEFCATFRR